MVIDTKAVDMFSHYMPLILSQLYNRVVPNQESQQTHIS
jgi:hypothetical protein